jgi:hypothetical protein
MKTYLESHGIPAYVVSTDPAGEGPGPLSVWVLDNGDEEHALQVIADRGKDLEGLPDWQCETCGEENEGPFGICWKCGATAPPVSE